MDEVGCDGDEDRLVDCQFPGFGTVTCPGNYIVEITCQRSDPSPLPQEGELRFGYVRSDLADTIRGRVEIFHDGFWGAICDDSFGVFDASVACRQLKFSGIGKLGISNFRNRNRHSRHSLLY